MVRKLPTGWSLSISLPNRISIDMLRSAATPPQVGSFTNPMKCAVLLLFIYWYYLFVLLLFWRWKPICRYQSVKSVNCGSISEASCWTCCRTLLAVPSISHLFANRRLRLRERAQAGNLWEFRHLYKQVFVLLLLLFSAPFVDASFKCELILNFVSVFLMVLLGFCAHFYCRRCHVCFRGYNHFIPQRKFT